jgi:L-threonylcarbamoyladenylate synthase
MGGLDIEEIERIAGKITVQAHSTSNPKAPGQLKSHYAPGKRVILGNLGKLMQQHAPHTTGFLSFQKNYHHPHQVILSPDGAMEEAARNLFAALRTLDKMPIDVILAELVPDTGLGKAINDRLRRAAANQ